MIKRVHGTEDVIFIDEDNGEQQADFLEWGRGLWLKDLFLIWDAMGSYPNCNYIRLLISTLSRWLSRLSCHYYTVSWWNVRTVRHGKVRRTHSYWWRRLYTVGQSPHRDVRSTLIASATIHWSWSTAFVKTQYKMMYKLVH
jgi:hypothetical protein